MKSMRYREAVREAIAEEMERDSRVFLMGEEVAQYQGAYKVSEGLLERFGEKRIIDTPITEAGFAGIGIGAAIVGLRPIIEFMTWNFSAVAFDQLLNNAAKLRQMSGGQLSVPIVFRGPNGSARQVGSQHSHSMEHFYVHVPGLKVVAPATPADAKGMLKAAIRDDDPVLFLESETLYSVKGDVPEGDYVVPFGKGRIAREGKDCTLISYSRMVHVCLEAAEALAAMDPTLRAAVVPSLDALAAEARFEVITAWDVLEHLPDPDAAVRALRARLTPDGVLAVVVPVLGSTTTRLFPSRWDQYKPPEHLWFWSPRSLRALLADHGLSVVREDIAWRRPARFIDLDGTSRSPAVRLARSLDALAHRALAAVVGPHVVTDSVAFYARVARP